MFQAKKLGNYRGNDVELCRTTSNVVGRVTAQALMNEEIPFTRNSKRVPFFMRDRYDGAKQIWVISINPQSYSRARRVVDSLSSHTKQKLQVSNV